MCEHPRPDNVSVYHDSRLNGHHRPRAADPLDDDEYGGPPSRFALCARVQTVELPDKDDEPAGGGTDGPDVEDMPTLEDLPTVEVLAPDEIDLLDLEEIVMWGLEDAREAFVYGRSPEGRRVYGFFSSAESARAFFSRFGELRLVYA